MVDLANTKYKEVTFAGKQKTVITAYSHPIWDGLYGFSAYLN